MSDEQKPQPSNLEEQLEAEKKRSEEYLTRLKYLQADFENLKKRFDRQTEQVKNYCTERLVIELLDVVVEEVRKGYIMKDKVIRPSIVKVAVKSSKSQKEKEKNE